MVSNNNGSTITMLHTESGHYSFVATIPHDLTLDQYVIHLTVK